MASVKKLLELKINKNDPENISHDTWAFRATATRSWIEANKATLPFDGALETILTQLDRGDCNQAARGKCWNHLKVELENFTEWDSWVKNLENQNLPMSPDRNTPLTPPMVPNLNISTKIDSCQSGPRSQSARSNSMGEVGLISMNLMSARTNDEETKALRGLETQVNIPDPGPQKPISKMTMMERQTYWLAKKKETLEAQRAEKEKENAKLSFKPNTQNSKRTFQPTTSKPIQPENNKVIERKESSNSLATASLMRSHSNDSKWNSVKSKVKSIANEKKKKTRGGGRKLDRGSSGDLTITATPPIEMEEVVEAVINGALSDEVVDEEEVEIAQEEEVPDKEEEEEIPVQMPFVAGQFWWRIEGGRGQHRVNDGGEFQMWSIYRRKDKSRDVKGVSMLVGRMEAPPYDEKVIQIMFDVEVWSEEEAFRWWQVNSSRYTGSACQQTGKLKLEMRVVPRPLDHSPIRSSRKEINVSPIEQPSSPTKIRL